MLVAVDASRAARSSRSPSAASSTSLRLADAVVQLGDRARACAARRSRASPRARRAGRRARSARPARRRARRRRGRRRAGRAGRPRAGAGRACAPAELAAARRRVEPGGRDHHALVVERARVGGHAAGLGRADVRVVRAAGREAQRARRAWKAGEITVMSGRCVPPRYGSLRIQASPGLVLLVEHRGHRRSASRRGAPGCARPASPCCPRSSNSAVEASRRSLMFAEWAERTSTAPISSHAARSAPSITCSVTGSIARAPARRPSASALGRASRAAPRAWRRAARRPPGRRRSPAPGPSTRVVQHSPPNSARRACRAPRPRPALAARQLGARAAPPPRAPSRARARRPASA